MTAWRALETKSREAKGPIFIVQTEELLMCKLEVTTDTATAEAPDIY